MKYAGILLIAHSSDDWSNLTHVYYQPSIEEIDEFIRKIELFDKISESEEYLTQMTFNGEFGKFMNASDLELYQEGDEDAIIYITEQDAELLKESTIALDTFLHVIHFKSVFFKCYTKHSGDELWSDSLSIENLRELKDKIMKGEIEC